MRFMSFLKLMDTKMLKENHTSNFNLNLFLLVPLFFIIHNFEKALTMAEWSQKVPEFIHPVVTSVQFSIAVTILSVIGIIMTVLAKYMFNGKYFLNIMCGFSAIIFMNAFFPHIIAAIYFKMYAPGVWTSIFLYLPFCSFVFYKVLKENIIKKKNFILSFVIGIALGVLLAKFSLLIGEQF